MTRLLWILGEIVVGFLVGGLISGAIVGAAGAAGWRLGPWMIWVALLAGIALAIGAGEQLRRGTRETKR